MTIDDYDWKPLSFLAHFRITQRFVVETSVRSVFAGRSALSCHCSRFRKRFWRNAAGDLDLQTCIQWGCSSIACRLFEAAILAFLSQHRSPHTMKFDGQPSIGREACEAFRSLCIPYRRRLLLSSVQTRFPPHARPLSRSFRECL